LSNDEGTCESLAILLSMDYEIEFLPVSFLDLIYPGEDNGPIDGV